MTLTIQQHCVGVLLGPGRAELRLCFGPVWLVLQQWIRDCTYIDGNLSQAQASATLLFQLTVNISILWCFGRSLHLFQQRLQKRDDNNIELVDAAMVTDIHTHTQTHLGYSVVSVLVVEKELDEFFFLACWMTLGNVQRCLHVQEHSQSVS